MFRRRDLALQTSQSGEGGPLLAEEGNGQGSHAVERAAGAVGVEHDVVAKIAPIR